MSGRKLSAEKLKEIHDLAAGWGKTVADRLKADPDADGQVDMQTMEQAAAAAARGLTQGTIASLVAQQVTAGSCQGGD